MCSIGDRPEEDTACSEDAVFKMCEHFSSEEWTLLSIRSKVINLENICQAHENKYLKFYALRQKYCCDPFEKHGLSIVKLTQRVSYELYLKVRDFYPNVHPGKGLCYSCYSKLAAQSKSLLMKQIMETSSQENSPDMFSSSQSDQDTSGSPFFISPHSEAMEDIDKLNVYLTSKNLAIDKRESCKVSYCQRKMDEISVSVQSTLAGACRNHIRTQKEDFDECISQLKQKFKACTTFADRILVLSVLPKSWTQRKIMEEFELKSNHLLVLTQKLVQEQGILPKQGAKTGHGLPEDHLARIKAFYEGDENCVYVLPDKGQSLSVYIGGEKVQMQKRLLLNTVNELHTIFLRQNPDISVSFSKFASLRPRYCVLPGSPGTHTVCVCVKHQNLSLAIEGAGLKKMTKDDVHPISDIKSCLSIVQCDPPTDQCIFGSCSSCPGIENLKEIVEVCFDFECVEDVTYKQWMTVSSSRWTLEPVIKPREEFSDFLLDSVLNIKFHDYVAGKQRAFLAERKKNLQDGEVLIIMDYSENYSFIIQESIQSFHWSNEQCTIHPMIAYYKDSEGILQHINYIVISDCREHNVLSTHAFQRMFLNFLKSKLQKISHVIYVTDGAASQYKSYKTTCNLCHHMDDFGISAEHHYFATSHGKTEGDGLGGVMKRAARRASLQGKLIRTAKELYEWAKTKWVEQTDSSPAISFGYILKSEIESAAYNLEKRFELALPIPDMLKVHCIRPISKTHVIVKAYSDCSDETVVKVREVREIPDWSEMLKEKCYITVPHEGKWCMAQIIKKNEEEKKLTVILFSPSGPAKSYKLTSPLSSAIFHHKDVLTLLKPSALRGSKYSISGRQQKAADIQFKVLGEAS